MSTHAPQGFPSPTPSTFPILLQVSINRMEEDVRKRQDTIDHKIARLDEQNHIIQSMNQLSGIKKSPNTASSRQSTILKHQKAIQERKDELTRMNIRRNEQIQILEVLKYAQNLHDPSASSLSGSQITSTSMQVGDQGFHAAAAAVSEKENRDPGLPMSESANNRIETRCARMSDCHFGLTSGTNTRSETSRGSAPSGSHGSVSFARNEHTRRDSRNQLGQDEVYRRQGLERSEARRTNQDKPGRNEVSRKHGIKRNEVTKTRLGRQYPGNNEKSRSQGSQSVEVTKIQQGPGEPEEHASHNITSVRNPLSVIQAREPGIPKESQSKKKKKIRATTRPGKIPRTCILCKKGKHFPRHCGEVTDPYERIHIIKQERWCKNCLMHKESKDKCRNPLSVCEVCHGPHPTILHE